METLGFLHSAIEYESPEPELQMRSLDELVPNASQVGAAVGAVALSMMAIAPYANATVKRGDVCPAVRDVQNALIQAGYNPGTVDGAFGPQTQQAVTQFQRAKGITADGQVGLSTGSKLGLTDPENTNSVYGPGKRCAGGGGGGGGSSAKVIAGIGANVRSGPGLGNNIIGSKGYGATVQLTSDRVSANGYTWAKLANEPGWIATSTLSGSGGSGGGGGNGNYGGGVVATNGGGLYARFGPGAGYGIGASYADGTRLNTTGRRSGGWLELTNGLWVSSDWVAF